MRLICRGSVGAPALAIVVVFGLIAAPPGRASGQELPAEVAQDVFLLGGVGCNVLAVTGDDGVLLIDTGSRRRVARLQEQVAALGSGPVRTLIATHFHFDHVGGSQAMGEQGVAILGHDNARARMMEEWVVPEQLGVRYAPVDPYPEIALPAVTFDRRLTLHFGGQEIEAVHFPNAHSDADIAVFLRGRNVVHAGDLYLSNGFPIEDIYHGGTIDGLLSALEGLAGMIDDETLVVPGHGPLSDRAGLLAYRAMLADGRDRIAALVDQGLTLEQIVAANPLAGLFEGDSWLDPKLFVWSVFDDLTGEGG